MIHPPGGNNLFFMYVGSIVFAVVINSILSFILVRRRPHSFTIASFIFFLLSISLWGAATVALNVTKLPSNMVTLMNDISSLGYVTMPVWLFIFSMSFVGRGRELLRYRSLFSLIFPVVVFLYLSWTSTLIKGRTPADTFITAWGSQTTIGSLYVVFLAWLESLLVYSLTLLYRDFRRAIDPIRKIQGKYMVIAFMIPLSLGTITDGVLPIFGIQTFPAAIPLTSIMSILIGYALIEYGLFELSFENILTGVRMPMITVGMNNEVLLMNEPALSALKWTPDDVQALRLDNLIGEDRRTHLKRRMKRVFMEGKGAKLKSVPLMTSAGDSVEFAMHILPVSSENQVNAVNVVLYEKAPEVGQGFEKNEIISMASHEIKTPLASIKLIADLLQKDAKNKQDDLSYEYLTKMNAQVESMTNLINDFMDMSRIQKGKLTLRKTEVHLKELLVDVVDVLGKLSGARHIRIEADDSIRLRADKERLSQVFTNLISNAVKYSSDGTAIKVRAWKRSSVVCVEVEDEGVGIPKNKQQHIFRSFYRVTRNGLNASGLGMGLYIAKRIVEAHKGRITIESTPGKGTVFSVYIPIT